MTENPCNCCKVGDTATENPCHCECHKMLCPLCNGKLKENCLREDNIQRYYCVNRNCAFGDAYEFPYAFKINTIEKLNSQISAIERRAYDAAFRDAQAETAVSKIKQAAKNEALKDVKIFLESQRSMITETAKNNERKEIIKEIEFMSMQQVDYFNVRLLDNVITFIKSRGEK